MSVPVVRVRSRLLLRALHESPESWPWAKPRGETLPCDKMRKVTRREIIFHSVSTEGANLGEAVLNTEESHRGLNH